MIKYTERFHTITWKVMNKKQKQNDNGAWTQYEDIKITQKSKLKFISQERNTNHEKIEGWNRLYTESKYVVTHVPLDREV